MKSLPAVTLFRLSALALAASLAASLTACSALDGLFGDKADYRNPAAKPKALEVPPDLTQLARESRYQVQGGVISASGAAASAPAAVAAVAGAAPAQAVVALAAQGAIRVERSGQQRWLVVPATPEVLWPQIKAFWEQRGFSVESNDAAVGVMETGWVENRTRVPDDLLRSTVGRWIGGLYDSGERDRFRTRIERTSAGSEIYVSHRGIVEVHTDERRENLAWRARPADPQLEAEMLARLMIALGPKEEAARAPAPVTQVTQAPESPARARALEGAAALEIDEPFDRAWRRVGLALDRGGFTVEDRDRNAGLYYVRYVDPKSAGKDEPGWWSRLLGDNSNPQAAVKYRISIKGNAGKSVVTVLTSAGAADSGENGKRIAATLISELR